MKCDRCGKELAKKEKRYKVTIPHLEGAETYTWCSDCYNDFMNIINGPPSFQNIKPAITQDYEKNAKEWVKAKMAQMADKEKYR